jgi:hypothetical protein
MKWESFIFANILDIFFLFGYWWEEFGRSGVSSISSMLESKAGSGNFDRSSVSGRNKHTTNPKAINPTPSHIGSQRFFFIRYQANGTPTTVEIRAAAISWKKTAALSFKLAH